MQASPPGSGRNIPGLVYFHGASSSPDSGPSDELCRDAGVTIFRYVRPGYEGSAASPALSLSDVAASALDDASAAGLDRIVVVGWSGGGPYALAAGTLGRPSVVGVALLASWAPMDPPASGLPAAVRIFMRAAQRVPRSLLRLALGVVGLRTIGHVDDVRRVARPWGFGISDAAASMPVAAWHALGDSEVPVAPWRLHPEVALFDRAGAEHVPSDEIWRDVIAWATSLS